MEGTVCIFCNNPSLPPQGKEETVRKFARQIAGSVGLAEVHLCEECHSGVVKAVGWREQVGEVKRDVRSLQRIILKMMRQLTSLQGSYLEEMQKLEGKIKKSGKKPGSSNATAAHLREGVLQVVTELDDVQRSFTARLPETPKRVDPQDSIPPREVDESASIPNRQKPAAPPPKDYGDIACFIKTEPQSSSAGVDDEEMEEVNFIPPEEYPPAEADGRASDTFGPCPYCEMQFRDELVYRNHLRKHTDDRPFKCDQCPKAFRQQGSLYHHKKSHSDVKPFQCPHCPMAFTRNDKLKRHMRGKMHGRTVRISKKTDTSSTASSGT